MLTATNGAMTYHDTAVVSTVIANKVRRPKAHTPKPWSINQVAQVVNGATLEAFFASEIPGIRFKNFLSSELCEYYVKKAQAFGFKRYKDAPEVGLIGLALVDSQNMSDYLCKASLLRQEGMILLESLQLLQLVMGSIAFHTGRKCKVLEHNGKPFWSGNWRLLSGGAGIHLDNIAEDAAELADMQIEFQGSFVLHISTPEKGGATVLYDKAAVESDKNDPLYNESGWKYSTAIVEGVSSVTVPAKTGELVFLPTQKYHSVNPSEKGTERISFSSFFVIKKNDPTIYFYS